MIHYNLICENEHGFEGWFQNSGAYDQQADSGEIVCPMCNSVKIRKALMAPNISTKSSKKEVVPVANAPVDQAADAGPAVAHAAEVRQQLRELRRVVEENCDNVGTEFAEEARKIHYGEAEERGIYGQATRQETEELADEGIDVGMFPWVPDSDA